MATEEGGGTHEIGTANFVFGGAPGMREEACTKLAQRISCLGVFSVEAEGGPDVHEFGTAKFVLRSVASEERERRVLLACGHRRGGGARTKLAQRVSCFGGSPGMREEACTKFAQRISCLGVPCHVRKTFCQRRGRGVRTNLVQRNSCLAAWPWGCSWHVGKTSEEQLRSAPSMWPPKRGGGAHEIRIEISTANFVLGGAPGTREEARTKLAQRILCLCVLLARGKKRARNWHSEVRAWGCSWDKGRSVHEICTANFVLGAVSGKAARNWHGACRGELAEGGPGVATKEGGAHEMLAR